MCPGSRTQEEPNCWAIGETEDCPQHQRDGEMRTQLAMQDTNGMTLAMLAARKGNVSILSAVLAEIQHTQVSFNVNVFAHGSFESGMCGRSCCLVAHGRQRVAHNNLIRLLYTHDFSRSPSMTR